MNESAATAWIIERLEIENSKMEEEMGNMDTCEEGSAGDNSGATPSTNKRIVPEAALMGLGLELFHASVLLGSRGNATELTVERTTKGNVMVCVCRLDRTPGDKPNIKHTLSINSCFYSSIG